MEFSQSIDVGVVVERRASDHPWQDWSWRPLAVIPGARPTSRWEILREDEQATVFHAATLPLELFRTDTESYLAALSATVPSVYVILRKDDEDEETDEPFAVHLVTASAYEAQDYLDSGEDIVEAVPMPDDLVAWVRDFVDRHHVEEKFVKRKRDRVDIETPKFGQEPLVELRRRMKADAGNDRND